MQDKVEIVYFLNEMKSTPFTVDGYLTYLFLSKKGFARNYLIKKLASEARKNPEESSRIMACLRYHLTEVESSPWVIVKLLKHFKEDPLTSEEYEKLFYKVFNLRTEDSESSGTSKKSLRRDLTLNLIRCIKSRGILIRMINKTRCPFLGPKIEEQIKSIPNTTDFILSE